LRLAVEIGSGGRIVGADISGLRAFSEQHPEVPLAVACLAPEPYDLGGVRILPYRQLLAEVP
jgi:hypothetical protein